MEAFSTGCSLIYFMYFSLYILLRSIIYKLWQYLVFYVIVYKILLTIYSYCDMDELIA